MYGAPKHFNTVTSAEVCWNVYSSLKYNNKLYMSSYHNEDEAGKGRRRREKEKEELKT